MASPTPRDTLAQIATMYSYDPATVISVKLEQQETVFTYRLADPATPGKYQVVKDGYLITAGAMAVLRGIASGYGYNPDEIVSVKISQYQSQVAYRAPLDDGSGSSLTQQDNFSIDGAAPAPAVAPAPAGVPYG